MNTARRSVLPSLVNGLIILTVAVGYFLLPNLDQLSPIMVVVDVFVDFLAWFHILVAAYFFIMAIYGLIITRSEKAWHDHAVNSPDYEMAERFYNHPPTVTSRPITIRKAAGTQKRVPVRRINHVP